MLTIALNVSQMHTNRKERMWDFTWKVSDCEELVEPSDGHLNRNVTNYFMY